jgi:hypothetical protein
MSFEHNSLKNLFLSDVYSNGLFHRVMEREIATPKFEDRNLRKIWKNREMDPDHDVNDIVSVIEFDEWDVGIETSRNFLVYSGVSKEFQEIYGDTFQSETGVTFCSDDDPEDVMMTLDVGGEGVTIHVDVCPTLGEEYPHVLREIERKIPEDCDETHRFALVVDKCEVESCSWEDLVDIFESHDIALVSFKEILN